MTAAQRDYSAEYRARARRAKAAGYRSFYDQRRDRLRPELAVRQALELAGCRGAERVTRICIDALQNEGWLR